MNSLGDRMKRYERSSKDFLTPRTPVIIRVDGRAFHTYTKGMKKPFDENLIEAMTYASKKVAQDMQGFKVGYIQSDEASFLITDYDDLNTQGWFGYNLSKIISITSSLMTAHFNEYMWRINATNEIAYFDARAFNIPENDIPNYFLWRAQDWKRNSLQMYCRSFFSSKELHKKNHEDMHNMLHKIGRNWSKDLTDAEKNGTWIGYWNVMNPPIFTRRDILPMYDNMRVFIQGLL